MLLQSTCHSVPVEKTYYECVCEWLNVGYSVKGFEWSI